MEARVSDLTVEQLRRVIEDPVRRTVLQALENPDLDLEVRTEFAKSLRAEAAAAERGETVPIGEVLAELGVEWRPSAWSSRLGPVATYSPTILLSGIE